MELIILFFVYVVLSFIVIPVAKSKGRGGCAWFALSLIISPIIVIIILLALGDSDEKRREKMREEEEFRECERRRIRQEAEPKRTYQESVSASRNQNQQDYSPPIPPTLTVFYVVINNEQCGPYSLTQLSQMYRSGQFTHDTLVWKAGMKQWTEAHFCSELTAVFEIKSDEKNTNV